MGCGPLTGSHPVSGPLVRIITPKSYFFAAALIPQSLQSFLAAFLTSQHFFFSTTVLTAQQAFLGVAFAAGFVWAITLVLITAIASARINVFIVFFLPGHALFRNKDILQCLHRIGNPLNYVNERNVGNNGNLTWMEL